eukprot:Em0005g781a
MYVRFLIFLVAVRVTTQDSCVSVQVSAKCSGDSYPACQSLENVFLNLSSGQWPGKCVTLDLLDGVHSLMTPIFINATADFSLSIIGSNSSLVSCAFSSSNATNLHSIHLYGLNTVVISSVSAYGCDRPFRLQNVGYLRIVNSTFKSFVGGGALDVYNCLATEIVDCSFEDNYATSLYKTPSIGAMREAWPSVSMEWCAVPIKPSRACWWQEVPLRGILPNLITRSHVPLANSVLEGNSVTASNGGAHYGGGAYVLPALSPGDGYYVSFENSLFDGNYASEYAAAIGFASLAFFQSFAALHPTGSPAGHWSYTHVKVEHFEFIGNNADTSDGGAIYVTSQGQLIPHRRNCLLVSMAITEDKQSGFRIAPALQYCSVARERLKSGPIFNPTLLSELPSLIANSFSSMEDNVSSINVSLSLFGPHDHVLSPSLWAMAPVGVPALKTYHCPNGYCIQIYNTSAGPNTHGSVYTYNSPEAQCNCNRSGFYPCLFAIQLAPLIGEEFPISFESIHPYLYYISSFLALYFPYDFCLLNNLNPLASYFLRYTPPLLVSLTVVITLVIRKKVLRLRSIPCGVLHTGAPPPGPILYPGPGAGGGAHSSGGHDIHGETEATILASSLVQPLTDAFKEDWRWWGAMELARRFLLLLFTLPFPGNPIPPSYLLMAYLCAYAFIQPYKSAVVNLVESNQDGCVVSGFTRFTGLLTPFYYLPLLAGVVCIAVGVASLLRAWNLPHAVRQQSTRIVSSSVHHSAVEEVGDYWHSTDYRLIQDDSPVVKM